MYSDDMDTPANPQLAQNLKVPTESVGTESSGQYAAQATTNTQPAAQQQQSQQAQQQTAQTTDAPQDQQAETDAPQEQYAPDQDTTLTGLPKQIKEEVIFEWQAPSRPFKNRNRQYYTTIGMIGGLIALILIFAGQMLPVAVVLTAVFLLYILNTVPPHTITNKITNYGIRVEDTLYYWEEMGRFWMTTIHDDEVLNIEVGRFPFHLKILLSKEMSVEGTTEFMSEILINEQPAPTTYEKAAQWLHDKVPIDLES